jgi:hypothetical protein
MGSVRDGCRHDHVDGPVEQEGEVADRPAFTGHRAEHLETAKACSAQRHGRGSMHTSARMKGAAEVPLLDIHRWMGLPQEPARNGRAISRRIDPAVAG